MVGKRKTTAYTAYTRQRAENIRAIINEFKSRRGVTDIVLAKEIGMAESTFRKNKANPGLFRMEDIWLLCEALDVPDEQRKNIM